jgi:hypothetical protein
MNESTTAPHAFAGAIANGSTQPSPVDFGRMALVMLALAMGSSTLATCYGLSVAMGVR